MTRILLLCMLLALGLGGCVREKASVEAAPPLAVEDPALPVDPGDVYVLLPASYGRHLAEGTTLIFDSAGLPEDLPVYASLDEATQALRAFESAGERARYVWKNYRLNALWSRDVTTLESGEHRLKEPTRILGLAE